MYDVRKIGDPRVQIMCHGFGLDIKVTWSTVQMQGARNLTAGMFVRRPHTFGVIMRVFECFEPLLIPLGHVKMFLDRYFGVLLYFFHILVFRQLFGELHKLNQIHNGSMSMIFTTLEGFPIHKKFHSRIGPNTLLIAKDMMLDTIHLSDQYGHGQVFGFLVLFFRVFRPKSFFYTVFHIMHDFGKLFPSRCEIPTVATPVGIILDKDVFFLIQGILQSFLVETHDILPVHVQFFQTLCNGWVMHQNTLLVFMMMDRCMGRRMKPPFAQRSAGDIFGYVLLIAQDRNHIDGGIVTS
mmetsp:Transcript_16393/g.31164  ORF Transcript_16393/g.31164 Transcript_16393/m.31164 type:complete len:295 (-) Transcript_16393:367-1251(-)